MNPLLIYILYYMCIVYSGLWVYIYTLGLEAINLKQHPLVRYRVAEYRLVRVQYMYCRNINKSFLINWKHWQWIFVIVRAHYMYVSYCINPHHILHPSPAGKVCPILTAPLSVLQPHEGQHSPKPGGTIVPVGKSHRGWAQRTS